MDYPSLTLVISYTISLNILAGCFGGLFGSKYAKFCMVSIFGTNYVISDVSTDGRRPCYLWCLPVTIIGSLGVARAHTVTQLIFWQFIQATGAAPSLSIGSGVIGDIYKLEERGAALGSYLGVSPTFFRRYFVSSYENSLRPVFLGSPLHQPSGVRFFLIIFNLGMMPRRQALPHNTSHGEQFSTGLSPSDSALCSASSGYSLKPVTQAQWVSTNIGNLGGFTRKGGPFC